MFIRKFIIDSSKAFEMEKSIQNVGICVFICVFI